MSILERIGPRHLDSPSDCGIAIERGDFELIGNLRSRHGISYRLTSLLIRRKTLAQPQSHPFIPLPSVASGTAKGGEMADNRFFLLPGEDTG